MAMKYCEFEPSQHRNKRVATFVFLDEPNDPHPLAICDVCAAKLKKMKPDAIVRDRKEQAAIKKEKSAAARATEKKAQPESSSEDSSSDDALNEPSQ